jgi:hypothetical protein
MKSSRVLRKGHERNGTLDPLAGFAAMMPLDTTLA